MRLSGKKSSRISRWIVLAVWVAVVSACGGGSGRGETVAAGMAREENLMEVAELLRMYEGEGYMTAEVVNPWDTTRMLARYLLIERGAEPDSLPEGDYTRVTVPLERSLVYSSVHTGLIDELGAGSSIGGVADGEYFTTEPMKGRISRGEVVNVGNSMSPSIEKIVALHPDAVLLSPFENAGHGALDQCGVSIIECADYMERTPKGRAEWMKFIGALYGKKDEAKQLYAEVAARYDSIATEAAERGTRPKVLTEMLTDGYWFVPGGGSYMARMIEDAGGAYPWGDDGNRGSLQLDFSSVYAKAGDADVWLLKSFGHDMDYDDLRGMYQLNSQIKAYKHRNVWVANTAEVAMYEEFPFHPESLLEEYSRIFRGERAGLRYFKPMK